jgi:signal transduction histidine kinase
VTARRRFVGLLTLLSALLALLSYISLTWFYDSAVAVSFWPANALILAFLLRGFRNFRERAAALGLSFLVLTAVDLLLGAKPVIAVGFTAANCVEIAVAAWVLRKAPMPLANERSLLELIAGGVILGPLASSLVAGAALEIDHRGGFQGAPQWLISDMAGMAVFAPAFLSVRWKALPEHFSPSDIGKALGAQLLVAAVALFAFSIPRYGALLAISPVVVLAVWSGREAGGAIAVAIVGAIGALMTALGYGPIAQSAPADLGPVIKLQIIVAAQILTVHPLAMALARLDAYASSADAGRREAERRSAMRAKLLAHVSHEIRSPLSGVLGLAELMRNGALGELTASQKDGVARIADCAAEMQALAADLLDTAAVESGRVRVEARPVEVAPAVEQAIAAARFRTRAYDFKTALVGDWPERLSVQADPYRLKQVLINLLVNAAKYGGRPARAEIAVRDRGSRVRLEVSDNGRGVPEHLREGLFRPFERLGAERSQVEGSGLGLSVARELVELQGGAIGVEQSRLGGARFWIELPKVQETAQAA